MISTTKLNWLNFGVLGFWEQYVTERRTPKNHYDCWFYTVAATAEWGKWRGKTCASYAVRFHASASPQRCGRSYVPTLVQLVSAREDLISRGQQAWRDKASGCLRCWDFRRLASEVSFSPPGPPLLFCSISTSTPALPLPRPTTPPPSAEPCRLGTPCHPCA
jgi:hypothetical protein